MRALSIRQPCAELILRGIKTAELRSMSTKIVGERVQRSEVRDQKSDGGIHYRRRLQFSTPYGISIANFRASLTSLILAAPSRVIRRISRDFGTVRSTSQLANESC